MIAGAAGDDVGDNRAFPTLEIAGMMPMHGVSRLYTAFSLLPQ
jgi:hypothetical protein